MLEGMRLQILHEGHRPIQKVFLRVIELVAGQIPGPISVMSYRKELFGKTMAQCFQEAMRESKHWSVAEVELFSAYVSKVNRCAY